MTFEIHTHPSARSRGLVDRVEAPTPVLRFMAVFTLQYEIPEMDI